MKKQWIIVLFPLWLTVLGGPVLNIAPETFGFGKYPANLQKEHVFTLTNTGDKLLVIEKVRVTCGCSAAEIAEKQLAPGQTTILVARIHQESVAGPYSKGIFIHTNASNSHVRMITLTGDATPLVTVSPLDKLYLGTRQVGQNIRQEFLLATSERVKFGKPEVEGSASPEITLKELPENQISLIFNWTPVREYSLFHFQIKLPVISPQGWKPVELSLRGRVQLKSEKIRNIRSSGR